MWEGGGVCVCVDGEGAVVCGYREGSGVVCVWRGRGVFMEGAVCVCGGEVYRIQLNHAH